MPLKIAQLGQPILRQKAQEIPVEDIVTAEFQQFVDDMISTVQEEHGVGLAGPQVFSGQRIFVAGVFPPETDEALPGLEVFINPRLTAASNEPLYSWEGCLSFRELLVLVPRYEKVRVEYLNRQGQPAALDLQGFPARVVQHEYDHLEGILTLDRAPSTQFIIKATELEAVQAEMARRDLDAE